MYASSDGLCIAALPQWAGRDFRSADWPEYFQVACAQQYGLQYIGLGKVGMQLLNSSEVFFSFLYFLLGYVLF